MTRFSKVFLRDALHGRVCLAGFGKHPAWDDHIDDIGLETESLVITKLILYSEGIASHISSGAWNQLETSRHAMSFDHRFVWGRGSQSIVGGIWASTDGKGRRQFPMIICLQCETGSSEAVGRFLKAIEGLSFAWKQEKTKLGVHAARDRVFSEIMSSYPAARNELFAEIGDPEENAMLPALITLSDGIKSGALLESGGNGKHLRLPGIAASPATNLAFWAGFADRQNTAQTPCLAIAAANARFVDLILGQPHARDFFCLRADERAVPQAWTGSERPVAKRLELAAKHYLRTFRLGSASGPAQRRSWWSGLFEKPGE
jgi:hypothetical protein